MVTIADSISKLSITGINIRDLDKIPAVVRNRDCPILYPRPDGFISGFEPDRITTGDGSSAKMDVRYTLTYTFLESPIGSDRGLFGVYPSFVANVAKILDAILLNDKITGAVDIRAVDVGAFGPVADPAGNAFHGCDIAIEILEFVN